jgi:hypothetical protein
MLAHESRPQVAPGPAVYSMGYTTPSALSPTVASSSGVRDGRWEQRGSDEQGGFGRLTAYAALSIACNSAERTRNCSRWTGSPSLLIPMAKCPKSCNPQAGKSHRFWTHCGRS